MRDSRETHTMIAATTNRIVDAPKRQQAETAAELAALLPAILDNAFKGEL